MEIYKEYYQQLDKSYNEHLLKTKKIIVMDIKRTYANINTQETKDKMLRILYNFSKRNTEIGYCQGMNFVCYHFLEYGFSEEETFWIMSYLLENLIPKNYYVNMVPLITDIKMLKQLLNHKNNNLVKHLQNLNVDLNFLLIPWFVMIFTNLSNKDVK